MPLHTRRKLAESSVVRAAEEDASDDEAAAINAPGGGMVPRDAPAFPSTGWIPSDLVFQPDCHLSQRPRAGMPPFVRDEEGLPDCTGNDPSIAALWSVLEIWIYEHFPTLAPERTRDAAYPYAASWIGAVRVGASLAASRRSWRVLSAEDAAGFASRGVSPYVVSGGASVLQHHSGDRLVPKDSPESMLALDEDLARLYAEARGE
ncbi:hypothetical protein SOVF_102800, partial [Spinacia oleracea]